MIVVRCQDCASICHNPATWRVLDAQAAWFYCDDHVPDSGVELFPFQREVV